eukprot:5441538-Pyramimonas_sp.AAC.1
MVCTWSANDIPMADLWPRVHRNSYFCTQVVRASQQLFLHASSACITTSAYVCQLFVHRNGYFCMPAARVSQPLLLHASCAYIATATSARQLFLHRNCYFCMPTACIPTALPARYFCMPAVRVSQPLFLRASRARNATAASACQLLANRKSNLCMPN